MDRLEKTPERNVPVVINGAGITGCTLALYLAQKGFKVAVYDKRKDFRDEYENKKRTVGMSISERGVNTLKDLKVYDRYKSILVPKYGRAVHLKDGNVFYQEYGKMKEAIYTINRKDFNSFLMECCRESGNVDFFFNHDLEAINFKAKRILFNSQSGKKKAVYYNHLFGCDGAFSAVRTQMNNYGLVESVLQKLDFLFKEVYIPPRNGDYVLDPNYVHIWNVSELLFVALPDGRSGFNGTLFYTRNSEFARITDKDKLYDFIDKNCHFLSCIDKDHFIKEFNDNPVSDIYEARSSQWNYKDEILLMGDAAHAMPPFYAMGMNTCMESVRVFSDLLNQVNGDLGRAISQFTEKRMPDADAMKQMAFINYNKLKNCHTYDFDKKWHDAQEMMKSKEGEYETEYFQVAFTNKPFLDILKTVSGKEQEMLLSH